MQYTVIGTLLSDPKQIGETLTKLLPSDFSSIAARGIYETIGTMHLEGAPITPFTVLDRAGEAYGEAVLEASRLYADDLGYYIDAVRKRSRLDDMQRIAAKIAAADSMETCDALIAQLNGTTTERRNVRILTAYDAAVEFMNSQSAPPPEYYTWGMDALDEKLFVEQGDFVVVGGYPSAGKTLLSLQFAWHLADKLRCGYFSFETSAGKLRDRLITHASGIPMPVIKKHAMNETQWETATDAASKLSEKKLDFIAAGGMTVRDMRAVALQQRYEVIFADYLQLIPSRGVGRYEEVTNVSKDLHTLAQELGITVVALAQLSRPEKQGTGKMVPPNMSSFRESGQIEQDADVALLLYPCDPNDNRSNRTLKCGKNKDGERFALELEFYGSTQTMMPVKKAEDVPDWVKHAEEAPEISMEGLK